MTIFRLNGDATRGRSLADLLDLAIEALEMGLYASGESAVLLPARAASYAKPLLDERFARRGMVIEPATAEDGVIFRVAKP